MPVPLDEFPVHQAPVSMRHVATSDRSFYDRSYFNAFDPAGQTLLVTGLGVYPNLGVIDAYAVVRRGDRQWAVRCSDALGEDRMQQRVGPYRVEVVEPLRRVRLVCDADDHGLGFDLLWEASFPALDEPHHLLRAGTQVLLDASRFAQVGTWSGEVRVAGETTVVEPGTWVGTRDRSWGIRPVGEPVPPGRAADEPIEGFWWLYVPVRFEDHALVVIVQEQPDGHRTLNEAARVFGDGRIEQLGWPEVDIVYRPGTRQPEKAVLHMRARGGRDVEVAVEPRAWVALHVGAGYGGSGDWGHGQWRGRGWVEGVEYDLTDPAVAALVPFGVIDHAAVAHCDGQEGRGLFEHASMGRHDPTGFADWGAVAP